MTISAFCKKYQIPKKATIELVTRANAAVSAVCGLASSLPQSRQLSAGAAQHNWIPFRSWIALRDLTLQRHEDLARHLFRQVAELGPTSERLIAFTEGGAAVVWYALDTWKRATYGWEFEQPTFQGAPYIDGNPFFEPFGNIETLLTLAVAKMRDKFLAGGPPAGRKLATAEATLRRRPGPSPKPDVTIDPEKWSHCFGNLKQEELAEFFGRSTRQVQRYVLQIESRKNVSIGILEPMLQRASKKLGQDIKLGDLIATT